MLIDSPTSRASLRRGEEAVDFFVMATVPSSFVFNKGDELRPTDIADGLRQFAILDHAFDVQIFKGDDAIFSYQSFAQFVVKVPALIGYLVVQPGDLEALLLPIGRSLDLARQSPLRSSKSFLGLSQVLGIINLFAGTEGGKVLDTQVDADMPTVIVRFVYLKLALYRDVILTALGFRDGTVFHLAFDGSVEDSLDPAHLGQVDFRAFDFEALRVSDRLFSSLGFELGVFGPTLKEVGVGFVQVLNFRLQNLTISLLKPFGLRLTFKLCDLFLDRVIAQATARFFVMGFASSQTPIVDKPSVSKLDCQSVLLFSIRFEPILKHLFDLQYTVLPLLESQNLQLRQTCSVSRDLATASLAKGILFVADWLYSLLSERRFWLYRFVGLHQATSVHCLASLPFPKLDTRNPLAFQVSALLVVCLRHLPKPCGEILGKRLHDTDNCIPNGERLYIFSLVDWLIFHLLSYGYYTKNSRNTRQKRMSRDKSEQISPLYPQAKAQGVYGAEHI